MMPSERPTLRNCQTSSVSCLAAAFTRRRSSLSGEMRAQGAAAEIGCAGKYPFAATSEDARPTRGQPGGITAEDPGVVFGVDELEPGTGESEVNFGHLDSLGPELRVGFTPVRLGVLDVGSNTVHLLLVDAPRRAPVPAYSHKTELKLAENLTDDGRVSDRAIDLLTGFVQESLEIAEDLGVNEVMGFATSAIRDARTATMSSSK